MADFFRIDWTGPLTRGRQVYSATLGGGRLYPNYTGGFLIGWDRWSDDRYTIDVPIEVLNS